MSCKLEVSRRNLEHAHHKGPPNKGVLKYDTSEFVAAVRKAHEERGIADRGYDWTRCIYQGNAVKVELVCSKEGHGPFSMLPTALWRGGGCPVCAVEQYGDHLRGDVDTFVTKATKKFKGKFEYDVISFLRLAAPMRIRCTMHDVWFEQRPCEHLRSCTICPMCDDEKRLRHRIEATRRILARSTQKHDGRYNYSLVPLDRQVKVAVPIVCPDHGEFRQALEHHVKGHGCPKCGYAIVGTKLRNAAGDLLGRLRARWGDAFEFDTNGYESQHSKIRVRCAKHDHWFHSRVGVLLNKKVRFPCPKCFSNTSAMQREWLDYIGVPDNGQHREVWLPVGPKGRRVPVDGYLDGTIYQFHGDFVHGRDDRFRPDAPHPLKRNGMTFSEVYADSQARDQAVINAGYNLIVMWESDWKERRALALGLPPPPQPRIIPDGMGYCSKCQEMKPRTAFYAARRNPSGLQGWCKDCTRRKRATTFSVPTDPAHLAEHFNP
jgi:hypothetical protein